MFLLWLADFIYAIFNLSLLAQPHAAIVPLLLLPGAIVLTIAATYATYRLGVGNSVATQVYASRGGSFGDPEAGRRRPADKSEIAASRGFHRGRISRIDYERIIAYRHYVHGEVTKAEYHQIMDWLTAHESTNRRKVPRPAVAR
jgi:hypothetical protein